MTGPAAPPDRPFRFFDNREKYLLFVNTCSEKQVIAARVGRELGRIEPRPPALRLFDAGMGDATVLSMVLREMHHRWPTVPFLVVAKEISREDVRISLAKFADRLQEHPQTVFVVTNLYYTEAPRLIPGRAAARERLNWRTVALEGTTAHEFAAQIDAQLDFVREGWRTVASPRTGNPQYVRPSVLVLHRADQRFVLDSVIPRPGAPGPDYDLVIVSQPYRARSPAAAKVERVLGPLARALAPGGRMIAVQSTGRDPGMEIIRAVWPDEDPFRTPRNMLIAALGAHLGEEARNFEIIDPADAEFRFDLQLAPDEIDATATGGIGTSTLLAAWNAAVYVAQIEDQRLTEAMSRGDYLDATRTVLARHGGLWFKNECFIVARRKDGRQAAVGAQDISGGSLQS